MQLQDGKLYETKHGKRFRVTFDPGFFVCSSFGGFWYSNGEAAGKVMIDGKYRKPHLVREVDECRWVPASLEQWASTPNHLRCSDGRHHQILVDREKARAIGQEGHNKAIRARVAAAAPVTPAKSGESGEIRVLDHFGYHVGFSWRIIREFEMTYLEVKTTSDNTLKIRL